MARIVGAIATSHTPTIGFAFDTEEAGRPGLGADLRGLSRRSRPGSPSKKPGRAVHDLQRSRHLVLLRSLLGLRARHRRALRGGRRRRRRARPAAGARRTRRCRHTSAQSLMADEFDMSFFQGSAARPRLLLAAVDDVAARARTGRARSCRCRSACCSSRCPRRGAATKLGQALRRAIESYPEDLDGGHRRHRRPVAPGARRARRLQQHRVGRTSSST